MAKVSRRTAEDLTGRRFGRLTVIRQLENRNNRTRWLCRCDCGNQTEVPASNLVNGTCKSCGCLKKENQDKIQDRLHHIDGTCVEFLEKRKKRKDNKSGFRGVYQGKNGRYRVSIGFRGKRIYLGMYDDFENAVEARLEAEKNIYGEFLELYHEWEKKSSDDPEWARCHPFSVSVPVPK